MIKFQRRSQGGFTLVELVIVIVLVGILSVVAVPKFLTLREDAGRAAAQGVAGGLASASAIDYAKSLVDSTHKVATKCSDVESLLTGGLPSTFTSDTTAGPSCKVTHTDTKETAAWTMTK